MRTLSKGNYRVVYDPAKNEVLREQVMKIINELK